MTSIQKTLITVALATVTGAGIYEDRQAAQLREKIKFSSNDRQHLNHSVKSMLE